jgi:intracellular sulfur oxidation DsrE/DsrF family protein
MKNSILFLFLLLLSTTLSQAQDMVFPAIQGYGGVIPVPFDAEKPDPSRQYKFVIELGEKISDKTQVADKLDYVARMYNLLRYAGIPSENIELAIVIYGGSTPMAMANPTYHQRFEKENPDSTMMNPNGALIDEFLRNGIQVIICGQSMMKQELIPDDIYPGVRMALSRITATTDLMEKGYKIFIL